MSSNSCDFTDDVRVIKSRVNHLAQGKTLLEYLSGRFTYHDLLMWQREVNSGRLKLNGKVVPQDTVLRCGDEISYLPETVAEPNVDLNYKIVFEDDYVVVIDKPGNLPTHPAGAYMQNTLWFQLRKIYGNIFPVNRLDMETSGLLIFTKDPKLQAKFVESIEYKEYYVLVHGCFQGEVQATGFIYKDNSSALRKKRKFSYDYPLDIEENLKVETSSTFFEAVKSNDRFTLIKAVLGTGRTHQIRATLSSLGFPVVGDKIYGLNEDFFLKRREDRLTAEDRELLILNRQALHSHRLIFRHVVTDKVMEFSTPIPKEISDLLS
ncbi:MAG: RluA family pseudouridine synthase [Lentisphaeria bacterium]|nr:RluA family pseudouridine synthase [Lentisphaeria bacterium]